MKTTIACVLSIVALVAAPAARAKTPAAKKPAYKIDERGAGQLVTTTDTIQVLAAPTSGSKVLQEYHKGAMMAVLGEATGTGYLYVSPCNACDNGFVLKSELAAKSTR